MIFCPESFEVEICEIEGVMMVILTMHQDNRTVRFAFSRAFIGDLESKCQQVEAIRAGDSHTKH